MDAKATNFRSIIEGEKQFVVPLFQRTYCWQKKDVDTLWKDIAELYSAATDASPTGTAPTPPREHFIGSFVTMPETAKPVGVNQFILIDGQQRMTTLLLFLAAIRQTAVEAGQEKLSNELRDLYLTNQYKDGDDEHKLIPTQADRGQFFAAAYMKDASAPTTTSAAIRDAFERARQHVGGNDEDGNPYDLRRLKDIVTTSLSLVSITLAPTDNPYVIFQSLNGTGEELTQGDLIRNYFFMRLPVARQEEVYQTVWLPMQEGLKGTGGGLDWFFRHYLSKDGAVANLNALFNDIKARADIRCKTGQEVEDYLREIARFAGHYRNLSLALGDDVVAERVRRINRWNVSTAYPLMLALYDDYATGTLSKAQYAELLAYIESFVVRRFFAGVPTNRLARIFATAYRASSPKDGASPTVRMDTLPAYLLSQNWPEDDAFKTGFVRYPIYNEGERCKLVLESLNDAEGHKEPVVYSTLTIEHIMPQTLTDDWKQMLGDDHDRIRASYLNTIGNLTLTGYNSEMGNKPYADKRDVYATSNVALNTYFTGTDIWDESEITSRSDGLAQRAVKIWARA